MILLHETNITVRFIQQAICRKHKITMDELLGHRRTKNLVIARHEAMWLASKLTQHSTTGLGHLFGGRDHTTIINAIKRHEERMELEAQKEAA